jgi:hypothetical protein
VTSWMSRVVHPCPWVVIQEALLFVLERACVLLSEMDPQVRVVTGIVAWRDVTVAAIFQRGAMHGTMMGVFRPGSDPTTASMNPSLVCLRRVVHLRAASSLPLLSFSA